jgi:hypothetical protein
MSCAHYGRPVAGPVRPSPARSPARPKVFRHPWRVVIVAIALIAVLNLGVLLLASSDTSAPDTEALPAAVEAISPDNHELTGLVDDVTVDLRDDLTGVLVIDGVEIPEDQLERVPELGVVTFRPGPDKELTQLRSGENQVLVKYWERGKRRPAHPPSFAWTFRAAA